MHATPTPKLLLDIDSTLLYRKEYIPIIHSTLRSPPMFACCPQDCTDFSKQYHVYLRNGLDEFMDEMRKRFGEDIYIYTASDEDFSTSVLDIANVSYKRLFGLRHCIIGRWGQIHKDMDLIREAMGWSRDTPVVAIDDQPTVYVESQRAHVISIPMFCMKAASTESSDNEIVAKRINDGFDDEIYTKLDDLLGRIKRNG
jgi:hypothetical protein